ncbi:MAG: hypothetical protein Q8R60_17510 [Mycobacteriales bacterium]|nr:hypothetical protein [Mycobacteriales bacterium]
MTDGSGQTAPNRRLPRAVAVGGAVVLSAGLLASLALTALGRDTADAATVLTVGRLVDVTLADGTPLELADGDEVPRGATVATKAGGAAQLTTRGREVLLGASTAVTVVDGARQELRRGLVLVDATDAPGVEVGTTAAAVRVAADALTRLERGQAAVRVAVFRGDTDVRSAGRAGTRTVEELFQVQVPYGGLTGSTTPLVLTGDAWEQRYALDLVQDDRGLRALSAGLDASADDADAVLTTVPAGLRVTAVTADPGAARGETLVSYLLATAAARGGARVDDRYATVRGYRRAGGSWGVVAALVEGGADGASSALDALLDPEGTLVAGPDGNSVDPVDVLLPPDASDPSVSATPRPTRPTDPTTDPPTTDPPTTDPDPVADLVDLVDTLLSIVPSPSATPLVPAVVGGVTGTVGAVGDTLTGR